MTAWSDLKRRARGQLHDYMALPAVFYGGAGAIPTLPDDVVTVRVHDAPKPVGDLAGTNLSYAEVVERPATLVLLESQMTGRTLTRGAMVVLQDGRGFHIEDVHPRDGITITVDVTPLGSNEMSGKVLPDGSVAP